MLRPSPEVHIISLLLGDGMQTGATYWLRSPNTRQDWRVPVAWTFGPPVRGQAQQLAYSGA